MRPFSIMLVPVAVLLLVGFGLLMRWERQQFMQRGLAGPWLMIRISTIPIALATAASIVIPAGCTSGMEGLAVFYVLLFTVAPVLWFGSHWVVGKFTRPPMLFRDTAWVAASPLVYLIAIAMIAHPLQALAWTLLRSLGMG
jgi:hypothetical protein